MSLTTSSLPSVMFWTNPLETATIFLPTLAALVALVSYSIISVVSTSCLVILLAVSLCKLYTHVMVNLLAKLPADPSSDPLHKVYSFDLTISAESVETIISNSISNVNEILNLLRSLFLLDSLVDSIKFGVLLYFVTYIGLMCNLLTVITMAWITLFTFPRLYRDNEMAIDNLVEKMIGKVEEMKSKMTRLVTRSKATPMKNVEKTPEKEE
eukprot:GFUD01042605.1.p1 GENE.GFUD01042605.1~~GFUD01042605.1.p1  ORF type:complete len:211 (+),score=48.05 GFUD01042605.1:47-679(+)